MYAFISCGFLEKIDDMCFYKETVVNAGLTIAADSGLRLFRILNSPPRYVIGDMDSVSPDDLAWAKENGSGIILCKKDKDYLDSELAVFLAASNVCGNIIVSGVWGGRPDQSAASLNLLNLCEEIGVDAEIKSDSYRIGKISSYGKRTFETKKGNLWSFLTLKEKCSGIKYTGLEYPLCDAELSPFEARGLSNIARAEKVEVEISEGELFYFEIFRRDKDVCGRFEGY